MTTKTTKPATKVQTLRQFTDVVQVMAAAVREFGAEGAVMAFRVANKYAGNKQVVLEGGYIEVRRMKEKTHFVRFPVSQVSRLRAALNIA